MDIGISVGDYVRLTESGCSGRIASARWIPVILEQVEHSER